MQYIFCTVSVAAMRKEPSHRSEMVSQLLFGEFGFVMEQETDFVRIKCLYDGYEGWVALNQVTFVNADAVTETTVYTDADLSPVMVKGSDAMQVSYATPVYTKNGQDSTLTIGAYEFAYLQVPKWDASRMPFTAANIRAVANKYLHTAYLWGGRSIYGLDCSGFAQQVYKMFDIRLLRDAHLQADQGTHVEKLADAKIGDVAFFHNDAGRIIHVGILLSPTEIIHASGKVRIDTIDEEGITNTETGKRTHNLTCIRRMKELSE
ncbi:MAG TPA: C40 family peptidase [Flavisolibacter sp.]|nr:C40 family peptidase [Flavisolibacter sp.]